MFFKLVMRNAFRHKLRTTLTVVGIIVAILAFGLLSTVVDAWYAGVEGSSSTRLISRNATSLVFPLPITYRDRIRKMESVNGVAGANWFGGIYISEKNFFPQFAVQADTYFDLYPEFLIPEDQFKDFMRDRKGAIIGRKLADTYGFKIGDVIPIRGTIYAGNWNFVVRAIYEPRDKKTDASTFFFHWEYLNESVKKQFPRRANTCGVYIIGIDDSTRAAEVSQKIDAQFKNSLAETLTETEEAFQLSFIAMTEAIVAAIRIVSYLVIFIIMAVMANTMAMSARERLSEYATLKALGFKPYRVGSLIFAESLFIALLGGLIGMALTFPVAKAFGDVMVKLFPIFNVSPLTLGMQVVYALIVGVVAALVPSFRAARVNIADGLRAVA